MSAPEPPLAILAELTHRCPLRCPYCSNPVELERASMEMNTADWCSVLDQAVALGVLQVHFSGGEPTIRDDLEELIAHATKIGLYSNLITSGVLAGEDRLRALRDAGLAHVQVSFQSAQEALGDRIGGFRGGYAKKIETARRVTALGMALTVNAVVNRHNIDQVEDLIELAMSLGAGRVEIAHVQYYGWALKNRAALMPTRAQAEHARDEALAAQEKYKGRIVIDHVLPDYFAVRPKACMNGWGRRFLNVTPRGRVLPCHAAETIPDLDFQNVRETPLAEIWENGPAFEAFRGTGWMAEPCRTCERREIDWGGCRCQAMALTGDAANTDPACALSPHHGAMVALAEDEAGDEPPDFIYRQFTRKTEPAGVK